MGKITGRNAALYARANPLSGSFRQEESHEWTPGEKASLNRLRDLRQKMREIAWNYAGIQRTEAGIQQGLAEIDGASDPITNRVAADD